MQSWQTAIDSGVLSLHPLPQPLTSQLCSPSLVYSPLSPDRDTKSEEEEDPEEEPIEEPELAPTQAPSSTPALVPIDVEMTDPTDPPPPLVQLSPSDFLDVVAASTPPPTAALAVEPLRMHIPDMLTKDLTPPMDHPVSLMDGFIARRQ
ncbi:hypothetical protein RJT34_17262 [Clitoria ternatea]|uniref:Uncharacterized protein n=1 Tax=Clitoria ternatea TaxID=43366 RepID=A0AAN9JAT2_CLITE